MKKVLPVFLMAVVLVITLASTSLAKNRDMGINKPVILPVVGSLANLKALLAQAQVDQNFATIGFARETTEAAAVAKTAASPAPKAKEDYSSTNIQVQGVDEADLVKTDGEYIYQVNGQKLIVTKAYPAEQMKIVSTVSFADKFTPQEIYIDEKYLVAIGSTYVDLPVYKRKSLVKPQIYPPYHTSGITKALVYDLGDKSDLKRLREIELEGQYVSSRKIGTALYLVANKSIDYYRIMGQEAEDAVPTYRDSAGQDEFIKIAYEDIRYFPDAIAPNYLMVAGINLDKLDEEANVSAYLGAAQNIYASPFNLYVAVTQYKTAKLKQENDKVQIVEPQPLPETKANTLIYKFTLKNGQAAYYDKGEVPGAILNQFAMDEHQGYFRIATTIGDVWRTDEGTSKNNIYILDKALKIAGKLENLAPGEKIYSARFMGSRGYLVTFKTVDPLFVIDLKNPREPKILGALKIPGYSDYLHPYDENHLIGFGKDTMEIAQKDWQGNSIGSMAYYQGMKMAVFDVSDVQNPVEKFKGIIGDRGTDSELLRNHKALLFAKDKNLLAFPVTVMEIKNKESTNITQYGEFTFQGAYIYKLDLDDGFQLRGKISHLKAEDYQKASSQWYDSNKNVERILYIGDRLYTLSSSMIKANDLNSMQEINSIPIPR